MIDKALIPVVAARFKALGEPTRLAILVALQAGEMAVADLQKTTGRSQPNVSQHLASLAREGLVSARREGGHVYYRVADPYVNEICEAVCRGLAARAREASELLKRAASSARKSEKKR
jgi:DNA-binding transcriptional ArsR family regulator